MGSMIVIHSLSCPLPPAASLSNLLSLFQAPGPGFTAWYSVFTGCSHHAHFLSLPSPPLSHPPSLLWIQPLLLFLYALSPCCSLWSTGFLPVPSLTASALIDKLPEGNDLFCQPNRQQQVLSNSHFLGNVWLLQVAPLVRAQRPFIKTCLSR